MRDISHHSISTALPALPGSCRVDSSSAEGIPDPLPTPEAGLPAVGGLHFPAIPGKSENPLALTATTTSLSASPGCLGAGSWDYGGLNSKRSRRSLEPLTLPLPPPRQKDQGSSLGPAMPAPPSPPGGPSRPLPDHRWGWTTSQM